MSNSNTAHVIRAGEVRELAIPADGLRIRLHGERPGEELVARAGNVQPHWDTLGLRLARRGSIPFSRMSAELRAAAAVPEKSPRREIPLALGGLAAACVAAWVVPWAVVAPYLAAAALLGSAVWAMWPEGKRGDAA